MSIDAMKQALEALEWLTAAEPWDQPDVNKAITSLRQAIAEVEKQAPYCWTWDEFVSGGRWRAEYGWKKPERNVTNLQPLYTHPQSKREWVGLTDEYMEELMMIYGYDADDDGMKEMLRDIETKLKEKNT